MSKAEDNEYAAEQMRLAKEELDTYLDERRKLRTYLLTLPAAMLAASIASFPSYIEEPSFWVMPELIAWTLLLASFVSALLSRHHDILQHFYHGEFRKASSHRSAKGRGKPVTKVDNYRLESTSIDWDNTRGASESLFKAHIYLLCFGASVLLLARAAIVTAGLFCAGVSGQ